MKKKNIALVLFLVAAMSISMFYAPSAPAAQTEVNTPPEFSPEEVDEINDFYDVVNQPNFRPEVDPLLASWRETQELDSRVVEFNGKPSVLIFGTPAMDMDSIEEIAEVSWSADLRVFSVVKAYLPTTAALSHLVKIDGVTTVKADEAAMSLGNDLQKNLVKSEAPPAEVSPDMFEIREVVGATGTTASGFTGDGVVVGHLDTGADFGQPDLQDAYHEDSYDPTGYGLTLSNYHANSTNVANVTEWLAGGNLLTYEKGGKYYLNVAGWDPVVNNNGGGRHLMGLLPPYGNGYPYGSVVGFIGLYEWAYGLEGQGISEFIANEIWKDWEIPDPANVQGNYSFGWVFQQRQSPYTKAFAPTLVFNSTADDNYHLVVDWEGAEGWTAMWNGAIYYESLNLDTYADRAQIKALFDWSFVDDFEEETYHEGNLIVATDYTGDGIDDFSLGSLCWTLDPGFFADEPMFKYFRSDGDAFALYFDAGTHGTATAGHVAAQGTYEYYNTDNGTSFTMTGIAPDAKVLSVKAITSASEFGSYLWSCGFDYNATTGKFYYSGHHQADLVTNSWGWITEPFSEFDYLSMSWTILSVPDYLATGYPGVLHVFSAGNEGSGFMTGGPPGCSAGVLSVGASTTSHWLDYLYGPDQDLQGIASFTSKGPATSGYNKPDVVAPGLAGYSIMPWYGQYFYPYFYWGPYWSGTVPDYTLFSGTSQAAPVAAGVTALVIEALGDNTPGLVKTIIQSTADDMGYDPATQGFGQINAEAACDFVVNNAGWHTWNYDSFNNLAAILDGPWYKWGVLPQSYYGGVTVDNENETHPRDMPDGGLYFGQLMPGESATIGMNLYDDLGTMVTSPAVSTQGKYMREAGTFTFTNETFVYMDTVVDGEMMYGYYNLRDQLGDTDYNTVMSSSYMTVSVAFDGTEVAGAEPWMFLYDWYDHNNDGMPNLFNASYANVTELTRVTSASDPSNTNMMPAAVPTGTLGDTTDGNATLVIHDPVFDADPTAAGHNFTCSVTYWEEVNTGMITAVDDTTDTNTFNVTLTAPADAEPGIHQGYFEIDGGALRVPWSYMVVKNITAAEGDVNVITDGWGAELEPYDQAMYGCMGSDPDDWDFRTYAIHNPNENATHLGFRTVWGATGNAMHMSVYDSNGTLLAENGAEFATSTAVIADISDYGEGMFYLMVHPTALNGTVYMPVNYTMHVMWYEELTTQDLQLTWTSNDQTTPQTLEDGDVATGDHVVVNATYPEFNLPNLPEYEVTSIMSEFLSGLYETRTGDLVIPTSGYDPFSGAIELDEFAWEIVDGIKEGDTVKITGDFTNGDCDFMVWQYGTDNSTWTYGNNLMADDMATGDVPEKGQFTADFTGAIAIGIFDYDGQPGQYEVTVDTLAGDSATNPAGAMVTYDTYYLVKNGTFQVRISATTGTNINLEVMNDGITFNNFFAPDITDVSVTGSGAEKLIEWTPYDLNAGDEHEFEVLVSADGGTTYQLLAKELTVTNYTWDSTGFEELDTYKIQVRVVDNDPSINRTIYELPGGNWPGLTGRGFSDTFSAGTVTVTEPTETTTTTTPPGPGPVPIDPLILGLVAGIGAGVVVVLILFLVKRR
ncbi:MAG: S8 family serine peptidase [Candidatus Lokiarchaeota archaeon]|nr:S8 family serine peptidase [Candidatus Lokiarchaeota archaeon]